MRTTGNINFVLIGAKATGKTVYLASLFLNIENITSKDGHTIEYLKPLADSLVDGEYPQATAGTLHELKFNYKDENISSHIQIDDVDGYFVESMHKEDETTQKQRDTLIRNIKNSEGLIFFLPYEESFNEESIKNFNYEIDTIISQLTKMYSNYDHIPIPAVIAVSKWDKSPFFKREDEDEKAMDYIEGNTFLKLAKNKIKHHFQNLKIIPISAIGSDIHNMEPYNLEKPLQFFIEETYRLWEDKIEKLKNDKSVLLKFLSILSFDMKFYKNGKYYTQYQEIEKEFSNTLAKEIENVKDYKEYEKFQNNYKDVIPYLIQDNRSKIEEYGKKLKSKQKIKKAFWGTGILVTLGIIALVAAGGYVKAKLLKSESELFSDTAIAYKNHNYKDAMEDIAEYQEKFKDTLETDHKNKVEEMKNKIASIYSTRLDDIVKDNSLIKQHEQINNLHEEIEDFDGAMDSTAIKNRYVKINELYGTYQQVLNFSSEDISNLGKISNKLKELSLYKFDEISNLKSKLENSIVSIANCTISEQELENTETIDTLLGAFAALNIDNQEVVQKLMDRKNIAQAQQKFNELKESINNLNYQEAINKVESDWDDDFSSDQTSIVKKILNNKFNAEVADIIKKMPRSVGDIDNLKDLENKLKKIDNIKNNTSIEKFGYMPKANFDNNNKADEKKRLYDEYMDILKNGVIISKISFGTTSKDNEPLGFECGSEDEIILTVETEVYHYDNKIDCTDNTISWDSNQTFKVGTKYNGKAIEEDLVENDEYNGAFDLDENKIIKIYNGEEVKEDIRKKYFIGIKR